MPDSDPLPWRETSTTAIRPDTAADETDAPATSLEGSIAEAGPDLSAADIVRRAERLVDDATALQNALAARKAAVLDCFDSVREELVRAHLATLPVERLRQATEGRLRLGTLRDAGYRSAADVVDATPGELFLLPGIGEQTATQTVAAARHLARTVRETIPVRLDAESRPPSHERLIAALRDYDEADQAIQPLSQVLGSVARDLPGTITAARPTTSRIRRFFSRPRKRAVAREALSKLTSFVSDHAALPDQIAGALDVVERPQPSAQEVWHDFAARAPDFYGILGELADLSLDVAAVHGHIPAELASKISSQEVDMSWLTVSLRGYQIFGAQFALVQRRCILGDEMGLGKTVEAIAALAHLASLGATHFLVVCPASVLVNWTREVRARSKLSAYRVHGAGREAALIAWEKRGGVAVTTYDTLRHFPHRDAHDLRALVVDEAHFVKNPAAQRSRAVSRWAGSVDRVLFLTGTPMENRVDEFRSLVRYLQPQVSAQVDNISGLAGAPYFRSAVAPVYLRRNQEDVLAELPERIDVDDWVELTDHDLAEYRHALSQRNFMAMRRASLLAGAARSAKLQRLAEVLDESEANGWKVVVFSYFLDVLAAVGEAAGVRCFGPLTGRLAPPARQALIDEFTAARGHAVLVSQINAGGTGLNLQAASVVVLTEPQWKPSIEEQAIARCHRMGQVRRVQVHRLLAQDCVDQRMLEILRDKRALFDEYVRRSALKDVTPDAVDIADSDAAKGAVSVIEAERQIIDQEQRRLNVDG